MTVRTPTAIDDTLDWHAAAMAGRNPPIHASDPQCGWFKRQIVADGAWVAARIWLEPGPVDADTGELAGDEILHCMVGDKDRTEHLLDEWLWLCAEPIARETYDYMMADAAWCRVHLPLAPEAQPHLPIILRNLPSQF